MVGLMFRDILLNQKIKQ